ncbi:MAG: PRC-barrel domain-containing protein [Treponema sp.]|jgi:16S rRNA processing protein RimM|nr:PRC-barrel domain-containing protein [Treponema sp.]
MMTERFVAGLLGGPFGLEGFIRLRTFSGETAHLFGLRSVCLRLLDGERLYDVEKITGSGGCVLVKFRGVDSPEAAGLLRGAALLVGREDAAPLGENEFYVEDLRGIRVVAPRGGGCPEGAASAAADEEFLGTVTDVLEAGGGQLVELRLPTGELRLVPFRGEFFGEVDPEKGRAVLLNRRILE